MQEGRTPRAHAYLCFTFGSNLAEHWPAVAETIDGNQSRHIARPAQADGASVLSLSKLGRRIEAGTADEEEQQGYGTNASTKREEGAKTSVRLSGRAGRPRGMLK